jgi:hypothetical protein
MQLLLLFMLLRYYLLGDLPIYFSWGNPVFHIEIGYESLENHPAGQFGFYNKENVFLNAKVLRI